MTGFSSQANGRLVLAEMGAGGQTTQISTEAPALAKAGLGMTARAFASFPWRTQRIQITHRRNFSLFRLFVCAVAAMRDKRASKA